MTFCTLWCQIFPLIIRFCFLTKPSKIQVRIISYPKQNFNKCLVIELLLIVVTTTSIFLLLLFVYELWEMAINKWSKFSFGQVHQAQVYLIRSVHEGQMIHADVTDFENRFWECIALYKLNSLLRKLTEDL